MIRLFKEEDRPALVSLLEANIPLYFAPSEMPDYIDYLDNHIEDYFVCEEDGALVAAGGINYMADPLHARISWDIVHPDMQRKGLGTALMHHRIAHLKEHPSVHVVTVRTTQLVYPFYEKFGFNTVRTVKDFWAPGFDLVEMRMFLQKLG